MLGIPGNTDRSGPCPYCAHGYLSHTSGHGFKQGRACPVFKRSPWLLCGGWVGGDDSGGQETREAAGVGTQVGGYRTRPGQEDKWTSHEGGQAGNRELSKTKQGPGLGVRGLFLRRGPRGRTNLEGDTEASWSRTESGEP